MENIQTIEQKLEQFIRDNNLRFTEGQRNSDAVKLSGYALHLGVLDVNLLLDIVENTCEDCNIDYREELDRVFDYAKYNNYGKWWSTEAAKKQYKF